MKTFCIIPAYNEEKTIVEVINQVKQYIDQIIIIDDGSTDQTLELVRTEFKINNTAITDGAGVSPAIHQPLAKEGYVAGETPATTLTVLHHIINRGQGAALKTGTEYALNNGADIIIHFDADGQFLASDIKLVIEPIKAGLADIVFGSRFLNKKSKIPLIKKFIILPLAKTVNRIFFSIKMTDPQSGFRAMSAQAARKIDWQQDRMAHCSEILFASQRAKLKIKEVPITVIYHNFGQRFSDGLKIIKDLLFARLIN